MLKKLREKLASIAVEMRALHALAEKEDRAFTTDEDQTWANLLADHEATEKRIANAEKIERFGAVDDTSNPDLGDDRSNGESRETALANMRPSERRATPEYEEAFDNYVRRGAGSLNAEQAAILQSAQAEMEVRAQAITPGTAGGFTVPEGFAGFITETMQDFSGLLQAANPQGSNGPTLLRTASGNNLPFPTNDDTANAGSILGENVQVAETDLVFGQRTLGAYMYTSDLVRVSLQLLQDEEVNLVSYLGGALGKRIGRALTPHFAQGTGVAQPTGLVTAVGTTTGFISAGAGLTYDNFIDIEHGLDPAYRRRGASYVFNDNTLRDAKKIKDLQGRPIWLPGALGNLADKQNGPTMNGYNYVIDTGMADVGVGNRSVAFGDLSEFIIREVLGVNLFRFNERYMDFLQIGWMAFARFDSNLIDTDAVIADLNIA